MKCSCKIAVSLFFIFISQSEAASSFSQGGFNITVEPIVGYEVTHKDAPTSHTNLMLIYGARFTAGHPLLAAEGEYTRGSDTEVFTGPAQTIKTDKENVKIGLRSSPAITRWLSFLARAGAQASRQKIETNQSGVTTTQDVAWEIRPYAGVGLQGALAQNFSIAAEAVYVFNDLKDFSKNDIQTTLALKLNFNAK